MTTLPFTQSPATAALRRCFVQSSLIPFLMCLIVLFGVRRATASTGEWTLQRSVPYDIDVIRDVSFTHDGRTGWIVGYSQYGRDHFGSTILKTTDGGTTWSEREVGLPNINEAIHFVDESHGWIVGSRGGIAVSTDGGALWTAQSSGTDARLKDIYCINDTLGWAVGEYTILYTSNGGQLWQGAGISYGPRFNAVTFQTEKNGWVVGNGGIILHTADGGSTWTSVSSPTAEDLSDIAFVNQTKGWAVGKNGVILVTEDGGATWVNQQSGTNRSLQALSFSDVQTGWVAGSGGTTLHTTDGGKTWTKISVPANANLYAVHFSEEHRGWVFGAGGVFLHTEDNGITWNPIMNGPNANLTGVSFVDSKNGWACGWNGTILHTEDGGRNWRTQRCGLDALLMGIDFVHIGKGWIISYEGGMLKTENGGEQWSSIQAPAGTFRNLDYVDEDNIWVVGEHNNLGTIFHGLSDGAEWYIEAQVPIGGPLFDIQFADRNRGWAVGTGGAILHTSNAGETWTQQISGIDEDLNQIQAVNHAVAWASGNFDNLLVTENGGEDWNIVQLDPDYTYGSITFQNLQQGWVVGRSKTDGSVVIFSTRDGGNSWESTPMAVKEGFQATNFVSLYEGWSVGEKGTVWYYADKTGFIFHSLSGYVSYCENLKPIPNVTLNLSGYTTDTGNTDEDGTFRFDGLRQGRTFCLEAHMVGASKQVITSYDASLVLSSLVGQYTLSPCDSIAADVTGNNQVSALDVSAILRYVVGLETEELTGNWNFFPQQFCYTDLPSDQSDLLFEGIIYGDVSQNWPGIRDTNVPDITVSLPHTGAAAGTDFVILTFASSISDSIDIFSYQAQIDYDPSLLQIVALSDTGLVPDGWGQMVYRIDNNNGHLFTAKAASFPLQWNGSPSAPLMRIHMRVNSHASSGATSPLTLASMIFNEGYPWAETQDGFFQVLKHTISGTVTYCSTAIEIPSVELSLSGDDTLNATTGESGWYGFHGLNQGGNYTVSSLVKNDVSKDIISSFDASLILRHLTGTYKLGACGTSAADVNGNSMIDPGDALLISRYTVGEPNQGHTGSWAFSPAGTNYEALPSDLRDQNYSAFVFGDVSLNYPENNEPPETPWVHICLPQDSIDPGATIGFPILIDSFSEENLELMDIYSCDIKLSYDPSVLTAFLVSTDGLDKDHWEIVSSKIDDETGLVKISMASASPLSCSKTTKIPLVRIEFYVNEETPPGTNSPIRISSVLFNEGILNTRKNDGLLHIQGKSISGVVRYYDTQQAVNGVVLQIYSFTTERTTTNIQGEYLFPDLPTGGRYCIFPIRGEQLPPSQQIISSYDAALISRHVIHLLPFSSGDSIAADVSGDGTISAYDASLILQYVVCNNCNGSSAFSRRIGTWHFEPPHRCFENLRHNETSDYNAVVYGDVSQNWPGFALAKPAADDGIQIDQAKVIPQFNKTFTLPLRVNNPKGILSADITLSYNSEELSARRASTTALTSDWEIAYHIYKNGSIKIAMAGYQELQNSGPIVEIEFEARSNFDSPCPLEISILFNEGRIPSPQNIRGFIKPIVHAPLVYELRQNHPNPFNSSTEIQYTVPGIRNTVADEIPFITLTIYNLLGQEVMTLVKEHQEPGPQSVTWDGTDNNGFPAASGIYFYKLRIDGRDTPDGNVPVGEAWIETKRMVLLK
ncbi:MAG: hypothetical protein JSV84_14565 [Gemmatimonadota bacterium]|nr:MAG: hypothetical protein JSV84_14565 [Gemmatimonadota bacterium]